MKEEYETIDLLEILRLLKKNLLVILAVTILLAVAGYLVSTFAMTPQYEASATLIVNSREDQAAAQAPITNDQLTSATKLVDTYAVILTSDTVLDKTISNLNLNVIPLQKGLIYAALPSKTADCLIAGKPIITCVDEKSAFDNTMRKYGFFNAGSVNADMLVREIKKTRLKNNVYDAPGLLAALFNRNENVKKYSSMIEQM